MKIELKNVKHAAFASEETACFFAKVYIDGELAGEASNDGHGGANMYHPWALHDRLQAYAATLPPRKLDMGDGNFIEVQPDADSLIARLLDEHLARKQFDRHIRDRIVWRDKGGKIRISVKMNRTELEHALKMPDLKKKLRDADVILNTMPKDEAFAVYLVGAGGDS
jgi:hypothetical protein